MKKTNKKINKKAFSKAEFMIMLAFIAILIAVGSKLALDSTKNYSTFKTVANTFANAVSMYKDKAIIPKNEYSLYETEKAGFVEELKNPFDKTEICDKYESYVDITEQNKKSINLICGEYLVEAVQGEKYKIYEIGEWSEEKEATSNDGNILYNYKIGSNLVLNEYVPEKTLLILYNEKNNRNYDSINDLKSSGVEIASKMVYRQKKLLKELN